MIINRMSEWIEITDDPATLPEMGKTVIVRMGADSGGNEEFAFRYPPHPEPWQWCYSKFAYWSIADQLIKAVTAKAGKTPTHWRSIS